MNTTIKGSNLSANTIGIDTGNLNLLASQDTFAQTTDNKSINGTINMTVYGAATGPSVSLGYGEQHNNIDSLTNNNANLQANNMLLNVTNDSTIKGATLRADETLRANIGGDLIVESLRDSSTSNSNGFNVSAGASSGGGKSVGDGVNSGSTTSKQAVLTSITANNADITVGGNTNLKGSLVAATDSNGKDTGNLNLTTNTLTFSNLNSTSYSTNTSVGGGVSHDQKGTNTIYINDESQNNALDYIGNATHEVTHGQIDQGLLNDLGNEKNEAYANLMGEHGSDNFEWAYGSSQYTIGSALNYGDINAHIDNDTSTLIADNNQQFVDVLKNDGENVDYSLIPGAAEFRWSNTSGVSYYEELKIDAAQDARIMLLATKKVYNQGADAVNMVMNLPSTIKFLITHPEELRKLPKALQAAVVGFAHDMKQGSVAIQNGLVSNDPKVLEAQAQAESTLLANLATTFIGAGVGKITVVGGKVVAKEVAKSVDKKIQQSLNNALDIKPQFVTASGSHVELLNVGSKGNWDKMINKNLKPNTAYQLDNGHTYITDANGNVNFVEADLSKITMDRNGHQQRKVGKSGSPNDQGGHLIASSLGGAGDKINLVPMDKVLNNGTWKAMEANLAKALDAGKNVSVKIDIGYPDGGGVRPNEFRVTATVDGKKQLPLRFPQ